MWVCHRTLHFSRFSTLKNTVEHIFESLAKTNPSQKPVLVSLQEDPSLKTASLEIQAYSDFRRIRSTLISELQKRGYTQVQVRLANKATHNNNTNTTGPSTFEAKHNLKDVKKIIAIYGAKGGVGKTTVSIALARILARTGFSVGLLDADIYAYPHSEIMNSSHIKLKLSPFPSPSNPNSQLEPVQYSQAIKGMSYGYLAEKPTLIPGSHASQLVAKLLLSTHWGTLDYLLIDMPTGRGDILWTLCQEAKFNGAVLVGTPSVLSVRDVLQGMAMFQEMRVKTLGIIENMKSVSCMNCHSEDPVLGPSRQQVYVQRYGVTNTVSVGVLKDPDSQIIASLSQFTENLVKNSESGQYSHPYVHYNTGTQKITIQQPSGGKNKKQKRIKPLTLRTRCRCDKCYNLLSGQYYSSDGTAPVDPYVYPAQIKYRGQHSVEIEWSDGHRGSIYPFCRLWSDEIGEDRG